jgi:hypothetical protein
VERVKGIEPSSSAWKAVALPLSYTRLFDSFSLQTSHARLSPSGTAVAAFSHFVLTCLHLRFAKP